MSRTTDVVVVGSGMAGLAAALAATARKCRVRVISEGAGALAIAGGAFDLLGYDNTGNLLANPFDGFVDLEPDHPYSLVGADNVQKALEAVKAVLASRGLQMRQATDENGKPRNFVLPTIMGTLKPTYCIQDEIDPDLVEKAQKILVISVRGYRDCKPALIINQLRRYPSWADREFQPYILPQPFNERGRSLNALDLARVADRADGEEWLLREAKDMGKGFDLALVPPILGARANSLVRKRFAESLGCPVLELLSIPPGVGGLRVRDALIDNLRESGVEFYENAKVVRAETDGGKCEGLVVNAVGREVTHKAKAYVIATGGIFNGGTLLEPGKAREAIFGIDIPVPENVEDWTEQEIFGRHLITRLGVKANTSLQACAEDGKVIINNAFFAGRTLGGYDYASEKSGFGVAAATGWHAGNMAADLAGTAPLENSESGGTL